MRAINHTEEKNIDIKADYEETHHLAEALSTYKYKLLNDKNTDDETIELINNMFNQLRNPEPRGRLK